MHGFARAASLRGRHEMSQYRNLNQAPTTTSSSNMNDTGFSVEVTVEPVQTFPTPPTSPKSSRRKATISSPTRPRVPHYISVQTIPETAEEQDFEAALAVRRSRRNTETTPSPSSSLSVSGTSTPFSPLRTVGNLLGQLPLEAGWQKTVVVVDEGLQGLDTLGIGVKKAYGSLRQNKQPAALTDSTAAPGNASNEDNPVDSGDEYFLDENCNRLEM